MAEAWTRLGVHVRTEHPRAAPARAHLVTCSGSRKHTFSCCKKRCFRGCICCFVIYTLVLFRVLAVLSLPTQLLAPEGAVVAPRSPAHPARIAHLEAASRTRAVEGVFLGWCIAIDGVFLGWCVVYCAPPCTLVTWGPTWVKLYIRTCTYHMIQGVADRIRPTRLQCFMEGAMFSVPIVIPF